MRYQAQIIAEDCSVQKQIEYAIHHNMKIRFQTEDTPEYKFILFHPYALLLDLFDGLSVIGLVEKHYIDLAHDYMARPALNSITFVEVLDVNFRPNHELWRTLGPESINVLLKA